MPRQFALGTMITVFGLVAWWGVNSSLDRPAKLSKEQILQVSHPKSPYRHSEKLTGPLQVVIAADRPGPIAINESVTLRGTISTAEPLTNVKIVWSLDSNIELISGADQTVLASLSPDAPQTIQIVVRPKTEGRSRVHLLASAEKGGIAFSQVAQWATQKEKKDFIIEAEKDPAPQNKIHH